MAAETPNPDEKAAESNQPVVKAPPQDSSSPESTHANRAFPVVGIGASAGGLEAFKKFFAAMPATSGMAFVVVPHLDPKHKSLMVELLARQTTMPVQEAAQGLAVEPNAIYVIPPGYHLAIHDGNLELTAPDKGHGIPSAIDYFFRSLAADQQERAIGIVLSGTSSQGTQGLKEIKAAGGLVMVQSPDSAEYDQMPKSAIATGIADYVLPPAEMPAALLKFSQLPYLQGAGDPPPADAQQLLQSVLSLLRTRTKSDFRGYRKHMLLRRVQRRMGLCHLESADEYLQLLRDQPEELAALHKDLLIGVTTFFREPEAFEVLQQLVIPELVQRTDGETPVRVWVPGCATGEEAYSLGMLLLEGFAAANKTPNLQIFATDRDEQALQAARLGKYLNGISTEVSAERLRRFFVRADEQHYQASKQLRESVVFAPQNLISDAPFSNLDLISCRNLLIYLDSEVQRKVMGLFHFALRGGGYLVLGPSESVGRELDLFEPISKKWRVFRRLKPARRDLVEFPIIAGEHKPLKHLRPESLPVPAPGFTQLMQKLLLADFAPASALINRKFEILSVQGPLANYLEFPPGELTKDLLAMARQGLRVKLRAAVQQALRDSRAVIDEDVRVKRDNKYVPCTITVKLIQEPKEAEGLLLVTLVDRASPPSAGLLAKQGEVEAPPEASPANADAEEAALVRQLEYELKSLREDLHGTVEEYESANEELKAAHEEVMSMNEELQSANEELETSKEELQSLNEELTTVNNQLQDKVEELERANSDVQNLLAISEVTTVFLDTDLRIKRFTPSTAKLLNLLATDLGRPIADFAPKFRDDSLLADCRTVLDKLAPIEKEVWSEGAADISTTLMLEDAHRPDPRSSHCYLRRILPYRTADSRIDGLVITLVDITGRIASEAQARRLAAVLNDSSDAITVQDFEGCILAWNRGAERMYGYSEAEALSMNIRDIVPEYKRAEALAYVQCLKGDKRVQAFQTQRVTKEGQVLDIELTVTAYRDERGHSIGVATTERDITERKRLAGELQQLNATLEQQVANQTHEVKLLAAAISHLGEGVLITSEELDWPGPKILFANDALCRITGYAREELIGQAPRLLLQREQAGRAVLDQLKREVTAGRSLLIETIIYRKDGTPYEAELYITPLFDAAGHRTNFVSIYRDISERKRAVQQLRDSEERQALVLRTTHSGVWDYDLVRKTVTWDETYARLYGPRPAEVKASWQWWRERVHDDDRKAIVQSVRAALTGQADQWHAEYRFRKADGAYAHVMDRAAIVRGPDGKAQRILGAMLDVTSQKLAEQAVRDREERLRAILNAATDAIVTIDERGIIQGVNPATEQMFGHSSAELVGQNVTILMPPHYAEEHNGYIKHYLETGEARIIGIGRELVGKHKDGSTFPIDLTVSQVDHLGLFTGMIRDISDRKRLQADVLSIVKLEQGRIGQELHDSVQQQLTGLGLIAQSLEETLSGQDARLAEDAIRQGLAKRAGRVAQGIKQALHEIHVLARGLVPVQIDSRGLVSALTELAASTSQLTIPASQRSGKTAENRLPIKCTFECSEPVEVEDNNIATHLYRIAQEAVTNAVRHGHGDQIKISLERLAGGLCLEVLDNGSGIDEKHLKGQVSETEGHRGLGLRTMAYRAGLIGGTLRIKRAPAGGTQVRCTLSA